MRDFRHHSQAKKFDLPEIKERRFTNVISVIQVFFIFLMVRVVMIEMNAMFFDVPYLDDTIIWTMDQIRFKLWLWGILGPEFL